MMDVDKTGVNKNLVQDVYGRRRKYCNIHSKYFVKHFLDLMRCKLREICL